MNGIVASFVGGNTPIVLIWFGLFFAGLAFIARALRDDGRNRPTDDTIADLDKFRSLPLRHVKEALYPRQPRSSAKDQDGEPAPKRRSIQGRGRGPFSLVK